MLNKNYPFMKSISKFVVVSCFFLLNTSFAQMGVQKDLVKIQSYQSFDKVYPGTEFKIALEVQVAEGWHINSHEPYDEYLIPTSLTIVENPNFKLKKVVYPKPHDLKLFTKEL
jgi:DsbC/DsbD-like thiol-disulfide interchange protein